YEARRRESMLPRVIGGGPMLPSLLLLGLFFVAATLVCLAWLTLRFIPNNCVGVVEKLWSLKGSVPEGRILALDGEAGYLADLLRGGIHFGYWRWGEPPGESAVWAGAPRQGRDTFAPARG